MNVMKIINSKNDFLKLINKARLKYLNSFLIPTMVCMLEI
jgi:hypothetical protein